MSIVLTVLAVAYVGYGLLVFALSTKEVARMLAKGEIHYEVVRLSLMFAWIVMGSAAWPLYVVPKLFRR